MPQIDVNIRDAVQIDLKDSKEPVVVEQEHKDVEVKINESSPEVLVEQRPRKVSIIIDDTESSAALDAIEAAKNANAAAEIAKTNAIEALKNAEYAKEMGDLAKEIAEGFVGHEVTEEEMNAILDEIDGE